MVRGGGGHERLFVDYPLFSNVWKREGGEGERERERGRGRGKMEKEMVPKLRERSVHDSVGKNKRKNEWMNE